GARSIIGVISCRKIQKKKSGRCTGSKDTKPTPQTPANQDELNSGISSIYEDEDEKKFLDGSSDEEGIVELADISFSSFADSKTDNKNYNWKLINNESVRGRLINMTKKAIEEMKKSEKKRDLCTRTEDGTKELSHSECAQKATMVKIIKDRSKSFRTNKCILDKYLENDLPDEALENTTIFELQLA
ncbi:1468_t:CDS:2, partial [Gigaspora margarita]